LTKSEERFRQVVESTPSAMIMVDTSGRIEMINAQAETLFGYPRSQLMGRSIDVLVPERYRGGHPSLRADFLLAPQSRPMGLGRDLYALRHDGTEFPVEIGINPIDTDDGTKVLSMIVDISDRKQKEERISSALKEKDILLAEIHHRVKNNLQIVHSLLDLQSSRVTDTVARDMLRESRNRINSMAIVHQSLYGSDDLRRVDFAAVLRTLVPHLAASHAIDEQRARITIEATPVHLPLNSAIPCGLIVNELVSNAFKHGFPVGTSGTVLVSLQAPTKDEVLLVVSDSGVGLPDSFDIATSPSLGLKLVNLLASQLDGEITIERRNPTRFTLRFSLQARAGTTSE
jgi:PAS domain S-box-containing protein